MVKPILEIAIDTREKKSLEFDGIRTKRILLNTGDYALLINGQLGNTRIERKSKADLFSSFQGEAYTREKDKISRAKTWGQLYVIAIEATASDVKLGYGYTKQGEWVPCQKTGIAQLRQMCTISLKYQIQIHYCNGREDMALLIKELLTAEVRV